MNTTTHQPQQLHEPTRTGPSVYSIAHQAEIALLAAEQTIGVTPRPIGKRDTRGVRGLACYVLKHADARWSWPDICEAVYGHRTGHATAVGGAGKWVGTEQAQVALDSFRREVGR